MQLFALPFFFLWRQFATFSDGEDKIDRQSDSEQTESESNDSIYQE